MKKVTTFEKAVTTSASRDGVSSRTDPEPDLLPPAELRGDADNRTTREQLESSRARYFDLYDLAPIGYVTVAEDEEILEANLSAALMLGTTRNKLASQPIYRFIHQDDRDMYYLHRERLLDTSIPEIWEMRMLKEDGSLFWCRLQATVSRNGEALITLSDCSENRLVLEELRTSEERHRLLANTMLHGVVHQDANGRIITMNPAAERILGKSREQFLGSSSILEEHGTIRENGTAFPGNEHPSMVALQTGRPVRGEIMGVFNPGLGELRWISIDAVPVFRPNDTRPSEVYTVFEDITERKQKDQAIRLGKEEWERTFDSVPDLIAIVDNQNRITRVNRAMADHLGLTPQKCIGQQCLAAIQGTTLPPEFCSHRPHQPINDATPQREAADSPPNNDFLITTTPLFTAQGEVYARVHVARDIAIQKRIEKALRENEEQLRLFIEHAPAALAMFDRDMRYLRLSNRWRSDYGLGQRDVFGMSHYEVFPEISEQWKAAHRRALTGEVLRADAERFERADGTLQWVRWEIHPWFDSTGSVGGIVIFAEEITERKRVEDELQRKGFELNAARVKAEHEKRLLAAVMEALPIGVAITDVHGGTIRSNSAYEHIWGEQRPPTRSLDDYSAYKAWWADTGIQVAPDEWASARAVLHGETVTGQLIRIERFSGSGAFVINSASPVRDEDGAIIGCAVAIQDITDLRRAEDARHAIEEMNRKILQALPAHIAVIDRQGRIIAINQAWTDFALKNQADGSPEVGLGVNYCEVCRRAAADNDADGEKALAGIENVLNGTLNLFSLEYACHGPHKKQWFFMTVVPFGSPKEGGAVISHLDISALKETQEALQASEKKLHFYLENSPMAVIEWDNNFSITRWTGESERIFGWSAAETVGKSLADLKMVFEEDLPIVERTAAQLSDGLSRQVVATNRNYTKNGAVRHCTWYNTVLTDAQGQMCSVLSEVIDITDLKRAEAELRSAHNDLELRVAERTRQLQQTYSALIVESQEKLRATEALRKQEHILIMQNRHAAMGEMIGNIAHQWRQPLNTLGLFTQRLGIFYGSPSFDKEFLDSSIAKSMEIIQHMSRTIDDFRNFFSSEREKSDFRVADAVRKTLSLVEASFKECRIDIVREEQSEVIIHGFPNEYAQVLLNIFINAKDALLENQIKNPRLKIRIGMHNGQSVVTVSDNAGGVPENILGKIFDPYFTTKGPQQGTGIGLFMSKTIIETNMGGRLTVHNTPEGAEFRIEV